MSLVKCNKTDGSQSWNFNGFGAEGSERKETAEKKISAALVKKESRNKQKEHGEASVRDGWGNALLTDAGTFERDRYIF